MTTMSWSKSAEDYLHRQSKSKFTFMPVRKAISGIFRSEKSPSQSSPPLHLSFSSNSTIQSDEFTMILSPPKRRRKRISFGRSLASPRLSSSSISSRSSSGDYFGSKSTNSSRSSKFSSQKSAKYLFSFGDQVFLNSVKVIEENESFMPPKRPSCPAPILNLSNEECQSFDWDGHYANMLKRVSKHPSEESFYCRGLQEHEDLVHCEEIDDSSLLSSIIAPNALNACVRRALLSMDFTTPSSSIEGSIYSMETASEMLNVKEEEEELETSLSSNKDLFCKSEKDDIDTTLFCPFSPKAIVRLELILPPYLQLKQRSLKLQIESNASTLELKESLCSILYQLYDCSISPPSISLFLNLDESKEPRRLENDVPLYQEGVQDDDEILVCF